VTILVEAAVESLDAAVASAEGGAHRIELCTDLAHGGTTPDMQLLRTCRAQLSIPVFVLIRPRTGDFVYTDAEHRTTLEQIRLAKDTGAEGIVTGALTRSGEIAGEQAAALIAAARPLPITFHRAFDACADLSAGLESLIRLGVDRVLTSGGAPTAPEGAGRIDRLVVQASGRIEILAGGGIDEKNVAALVRESGVREVHFSVRDAKKVRKIMRALVLSILAFVLVAIPAAAQNAVVTRNVNLRAGHSKTAAVKETLHPSDELTILDSVQNNGYYLIVEVTPRWREFVSHQGTGGVGDSSRDADQDLPGHTASLRLTYPACFPS
jgi:copper homeostasis protein